MSIVLVLTEHNIAGKPKFFQIESSAIKVSMLYNPGMTNK